MLKWIQCKHTRYLWTWSLKSVCVCVCVRERDRPFFFLWLWSCSEGRAAHWIHMCPPSLGHFVAPPVILDLKPDLRSHYSATHTKKITSRGGRTASSLATSLCFTFALVETSGACLIVKKKRKRKRPHKPHAWNSKDSSKSYPWRSGSVSCCIYIPWEMEMETREREGGSREKENRRGEGEVWRECGSRRRGERKQSLTLLTVTSLVYKPTRGYGICKKHVDFSRVILIASSCGVCWEKTIRGEQTERSFWKKGGGGGN